MDQHVEQGILERYAEYPEQVRDRAAIEIHLTNCDTCRAFIEECRTFTNLLREAASWIPFREHDELPTKDDPSIFAFERRIDAENAAAEELIRDLLDESPSAFVWENIPGQERYQTGGVVRILAAEAHKACEKKPRRALAFARAAAAIADGLPDNTYPFHGIHDMRGVAWKECANAYRYLGNLPAALDALTRAERAFRKGPAPILGVAIVTFVRATVLFEQERLDAALEEVRKCTSAFEELRMTPRYVAAKNVEGCILYRARRLAEARLIFAQILDHGEASNDKEWIARASLNLGSCDSETGDYSAALSELSTASHWFSELGLTTELLRTQSVIGQTFLSMGKRAEAIKRLDAASKSMADIGMILESALAKLYALEGRLPDGRNDELAAIAQKLVRTFVDAGRISGALAALAYVKELALKNQLTPATLAYVRDFLTRSDRTPDLAFAPPPPDRTS